MSKKKFLLTLVLMIFVFTPLRVQAQLDDPTRPPGYRLVLPGDKKTKSIRQFFLSSVRISPIRSSAIINGRSVEVGNVVDGAKVLTIYPSAVKLRKEGKAFTIKLVSQIVKKIRVH